MSDELNGLPGVVAGGERKNFIGAKIKGSNTVPCRGKKILPCRDLRKPEFCTITANHGMERHQKTANFWSPVATEP